MVYSLRESFIVPRDRLTIQQMDRKKTLFKEDTQSGAGLGAYLSKVEETVDDLQKADVVSRIWARDHTVWEPDPGEIINRLGWLSVTDLMREQIPSLNAFATEIVEAGFRHVVLLGMGGSSLGPEVLRQTFMSAPGYPELIVLDSTVPASVKAVADSIDPSTTLFLVSSKSGSTAETNALYAYFRSVVEQSIGEQRAGESFVAITDRATPLGKLAAEERYRHTFINPPDLGGRYSVLSYFGLVPAALLGIDLRVLLDRADDMRARCGCCVPIRDNPGVSLGATMAALASEGRDKLTLATSTSISGFGLWAEQLVAESTGKKGQGIVPIVGEPQLSPECYDDDRLFVYLLLPSNGSFATEKPSYCLTLHDKYDIGAEFFRWEFATAVAGSILDINPFDQPDVQAAKDMTNTLLQAHRDTGKLPVPKTSLSLRELLSAAKSGDYLAILAYVKPGPDVDRASSRLRCVVTEGSGIATTAGYGPRYLHSTGQLHKGGPDSGLFLLLTSDHEYEIPVPGRTFSFATLADAQALGDLQALQDAGCRVARVHLDGDMPAAINQLVDEIG